MRLRGLLVEMEGVHRTILVACNPLLLGNELGVQYCVVWDAGDDGFRVQLLADSALMRFEDPELRYVLLGKIYFPLYERDKILDQTVLRGEDIHRFLDYSVNFCAHVLPKTH